MNSVAIQTEVAHQSRALGWGQTLCGQRLRIWLLLDTHEAAAYEDKLAAQVRVLDEALDAEEAREIRVAHEPEVVGHASVQMTARRD